MLHACALTRLKHFGQHSTPLHGYIYTRRIFTCSTEVWVKSIRAASDVIFVLKVQGISS
jgi:hypothetical protein